jgi:ketosteroid isomerase-like protein
MLRVYPKTKKWKIPDEGEWMTVSRIMAAALGITLVLGAGASAKTKKDAGRQQLCRRVQEFGKAWARADFVTMDRLLAPGYIHTDDRGQVQNRSAWLKLMHRRAPQLRTLKISFSDIQIRLMGKLALVTGGNLIRSTVKMPMPAEHLRFTQLWVRNPSGWQRLAFQATPVFADLKFSDVQCGRKGPGQCSGRVKFRMPGGKLNGKKASTASGNEMLACRFEDETGKALKP